MPMLLKVELPSLVPTQGLSPSLPFTTTLHLLTWAPVAKLLWHWTDPSLDGAHSLSSVQASPGCFLPGR